MTVIMRISHGIRGERLGEAPMLIRDAADFISPLSGQKVESKSAYYRELKRKGLDIDDRRIDREIKARPHFDQSDLKTDIARAIANPQPETPDQPIPELD